MFRGNCRILSNVKTGRNEPQRGLAMISMWVTYGLPVAALILGAASYLYVRHSAHSFDRKYSRHLYSGE